MDWPASWCTDHLRAAPAAVLFERRSLSKVVGLRPADGREVVVKARPDEDRPRLVSSPCAVRESSPG